MTVEIKGLGTITASEDALNLLSILASEASNGFKKRGREMLSEEAKEIAYEIYEELASIGFYEGVV